MGPLETNKNGTEKLRWDLERRERRRKKGNGNMERTGRLTKWNCQQRNRWPESPGPQFISPEEDGGLKRRNSNQRPIGHGNRCITRPLLASRLIMELNARWVFVSATCNFNPGPGPLPKGHNQGWDRGTKVTDALQNLPLRSEDWRSGKYSQPSLLKLVRILCQNTEAAICHLESPGGNLLKLPRWRWGAVYWVPAVNDTAGLPY